MKRLLTLTLCAILLLCSCNGNTTTAHVQTSETEETTSSATETTAETTAGTTTANKETTANTTEAATAPKTEAIITARNLDTISFADISDSEFIFKDDYLKQYWKNHRDELKHHTFIHKDENELILRGVDEIRVRKSSGKITCDESEMQTVYDSVMSGKYIALDKAMEDSVYSYTYYVDSAVFEIEEISTGSQPKLFVKSITSGYNIYDTVTVHAFIHKDSEGRISFLVDPEYLIGIPVFANKPEHLTFDLNGLKVAADSFMVSTGKNSDEEILKAFEGKGEDYFYAEVVFGGVEIYYNSERGCGVSADLISVTPVSDDIEAAISGAFLMNDDEDKNPGMVNTYNVIMNNLDTLYTEKTYGIVLLDMDFDGTPEVLSTRYEWEGDRPNYYGSSPITDIYRIVGEELKYIDSIASTYYSLGGQDGINTLLGLKNLSDGTKGWFGMSHQDFKTKEINPNNEYCYIYKLDGDTLTATELFSVIGDEYYYGSEKMEFTEWTVETEMGAIEHYSWNEYEGAFSPLAVYFGIKNKYCADIEESYVLFSDWIVPFEKNKWYSDTEDYSYSSPKIENKANLSNRELSYKIAYLVDAFYLGDYDKSEGKYVYSFYGAWAKPVIYLYPEEETDVSVQVDFNRNGELTCTYPEYKDGWKVTAMPDGTLYDENGDEYYCLYWEADGNALFDNSKGFCVKGEDTAEFLREKLMYIGLTAREANEFIIYWLPIMQENPYNIITFHTDDYVNAVPLTVSPIPDSVIRVFMTFRASNSEIVIPIQTLPQYKRNGFTVVEWGGGEIK